MDTQVSYTVGSVTVYANQARVTVYGELPLKSGRQTLLFDDLPVSLIQDSVRFSGRGEASVRVFGVDLRRTHHEQTTAPKVRELEKKIEEIEDRLLELSDDKDVLEAEAEYILGMLEATEQYARGLAIGRTKATDQEQLARSLREQNRNNKKAAREISVEERAERDTLDKLERDLADLRSARRKDRYQVQVEVNVLAEGRYRAELNYIVRDASWTPIYDIRLLEQGDVNTLQVTSIAEVTQRSGQGWTDVTMVLSTARTGLTQRMPEVKPWFVDVYMPPQPRVQAKGMRAMAAPAPQAAPLLEEDARFADYEVATGITEVAVAESSTVQSVTSYTVEGQVDIPSDGFPHKTTIGDFHLAPVIDYFAVPVHTDAIYRRVKATNDGHGPMLAGKAGLFVGDDYIGTSSLDYLAPGDEMELLLGVEDLITVERELVRRDVDKARLRDRRQLVFGYELTLKNLLSKEVEIEVEDHFPVSKHEDIKIKLLDISPEPEDQSELNLLTWQVKIGSGEELKIRFEFQVEHPRSLPISGISD